MSKTQKLTETFVNEQIENILDNKDLPCDAEAAEEMIAGLATGFAAWKKDNADFVKKNKDEVTECEKGLAQIIQGYKDVQANVKKSDDLETDCSIDGDIGHAMLTVNWELDSLHGCLNGLLARAQDFAKEASAQK